MANALGQTSKGEVAVTTVKDPKSTDVNIGGVSTVQKKAKAAKVTDVKWQGAPRTAVDSSAGVTEGTSQTATADERSMGEQADAAYQAKSIMGESSPLMRMAKQEGMLSAAKRGLGNSSIAAGASQAAMSKAAVPLAQQNAAQQQKQELTNQQAANAAEQLNVQEGNKMEQLNVTEANKANMLDATEQNKMEMQHADTQAKKLLANADAANKSAMQKAGMDGEIARTWLSGEISKNLAGIQGQYQQIIATSQLAGQMYSSTMDSMAQMWANSEIPIKQKTALGKVALNQLENGLKVNASITNMNFRTKVPK